MSGVRLVHRGQDLSDSMSQYLVERLRRAANVKIETDSLVVELLGDDHLRSVKIRDGEGHVVLRRRFQRLYITSGRLSEETLVLATKLARAFVTDLETCTRCIELICEHLPPCRLEPKLLLELKRAHGCEIAKVMM